MVMKFFTGGDCKGTQAKSGLRGLYEVQAERNRHRYLSSKASSITKMLLILQAGAEGNGIFPEKSHKQPAHSQPKKESEQDLLARNHLPGIMLFLGLLYKKEFVTEKSMHFCITTLLTTIPEAVSPLWPVL